jgi:tetratricopeptide repeat protein 19, mitochondrial
MNFNNIKAMSAYFKHLTTIFKYSQRLSKQTAARTTQIHLQNKQFSIIPLESNHNSHEPNHNVLPKVLLSASLFSFFSKKDEDDTPENNLITSIKRSILCIQRGEYNQAEQILHVALRMAQDMQHKDGITFIYDVMANLALEKGDFVKAEKLFVTVMQRLFGDGYTEESLKMLHMSSKMAHLAHLQKHLEKAMQGFEWTLEKLEYQIKQATTSDEDLLELWGLTKNWYAQALMDKDRFAEAKKCFQEAYTVYTKIHGKVNEEALMMLNNLSVACTNVSNVFY